MIGLSERIRERRKKEGLTQEQLAYKVGVSRAAVSQWENGDIKNISAIHMVATANALGVNLTWLITGKLNYTDKNKVNNVNDLSIQEPAIGQSDLSHNDDETDLLNKYRTLTKTQRAHLQLIVDTFLLQKK